MKNSWLFIYNIYTPEIMNISNLDIYIMKLLGLKVITYLMDYVLRVGYCSVLLMINSCVLGLGPR